MENKLSAHFHLPGLFEFYDFYSEFLPLFYEHREYFYDWCDIGSIYGSPADCLWGGGRVENGEASPEEVWNLLQKYKVSARLTFSNSLLEQEHLSDKNCNRLCKLFAGNNNSESSVGNSNGNKQNGIIIHSDLLLHYLQQTYPDFYFVSSTTKVLTDFDDLAKEVNRDDFSYVVPDFRLNRAFDMLKTLSADQKRKIEFLCNECCSADCHDRKVCYQAVSRKNLGLDGPEHICNAKGGKQGYLFSKAMENPCFISLRDIQNIYMPMGFSEFKIEGRGLGSAMLLEFLLYYMTKPEYHIHVRERLYLDAMLDLF